MFLRKDNTLKWNRIAFALAAVIVLCLAGIFWFDKPLYLFLRQFDWQIWGLIGTVSDDKVWLSAFGAAALLIFGKSLIKSKDKSPKQTKQFSLKKIIANFIDKSKNNQAFLIFCSIFLAGAVSAVLKFGLGRARPVFFEALGHTGFYPFSFDWAFNSMPSGHAAASFAGLVMIGLLFPRIKWATWTVAIIIGVSRVCHGSHWPTDVLLGAFIGMLSADIVKNRMK
jgi:membrane-associated phospholipid phosphatase